tara:strand:- start:440 stop:574 length:135 start_codon:yes stop_codon:yes gene_type:complete
MSKCVYLLEELLFKKVYAITIHTLLIVIVNEAWVRAKKSQTKAR